LRNHPDRPDGILYRARHDDDQFSIALFEPASANPHPPLMTSGARARPLFDETQLMARLIGRYRLTI
jgi:hypothetical protein